MLKENIKKILFVFVCTVISGAVFFQHDQKNIAKATAAVENLDEIVLRKLRTATWGYSLLQDNSNGYIWQPESFNYNDVTTGSEVWRITNSPDKTNRTQDIGITHWSANGKRLMFHSNRATDAFAYANGVNYMWMNMNTDGSYLRPAKESPAHLNTVDAYPTWSPILADVFYSGYCNDGQSTSPNVLYKVAVSDSSMVKSNFLTLPSSVTSGLSLKKAISADGRKSLVKAKNINTFYPITLFPESQKAIDDADGYNSVLNFDFYWGGTVSWTGYHDQYMTGAVNGINGIWFILMPETSAADGPFWRARLVGSAADGAPLHITDREYPYDWGGEIEPVNTVTDNVNKPSPWCGDGSPTPIGGVCINAAGHGLPDRWGHYLLSSKGNNANYGGTGVSFIDMETHAYAKIFNLGMQTVTHPDWEAWSDWSISSGSSGTGAVTSGPLNPQSVYMQNMFDNKQTNIAFTHARYNETANPSYTANARPTQSPDGTKIMFNSTFLNPTDDNSQIFWTVAYYPYPPEIKSASKSSNNIRLTWDFNQGENCSSDAGTTPRTGPTPNFVSPRTYATRGWPNETLDCPPSPREIKNFRIWSSDDNSTWTPIGTSTYNNCSANNECGMWTQSSWNFDATQANNTTKYYAITSLEHSGLESKTLSNVWKVTTDESGNITENIEQSIYPADPGGKTNFFQAKPDAPTNITSTHKLAPASADGQYTLTWSAPTNKSLIRYYNIYAHDGSIPTATQQMRIASIPATSDYDNDGNFKYLDWIGNTNGSTKYVVTSVDFQGNESLVVGDEIAPSAPSGLSVQ